MSAYAISSRRIKPAPRTGVICRKEHKKSDVDFKTRQNYSTLAFSGIFQETA